MRRTTSSLLIVLALALSTFPPFVSAADDTPVMDVPNEPTEELFGAYNVVWKAPAGVETSLVEWDLGDGVTRQAALPDHGVRHKYADDGEYTVRVRFTLSDGSSVEASETVTVLNVAPSAFFQPEIDDEVVLGVKGEPVTVPVRYSDPGADDLTITWPDGTTESHASTGAHPTVLDREWSFTVEIEGVTQAALRVRDDDGGASVTPITIVTRGTFGCDLGRGVWVNAFDGKGNDALTEETARAYADVVGASSTAFSDVSGLGFEVELLKAKDSKRDRAKATMLLAWLTFASGAGELEPLQKMDAALGAGHPKAAAKMAHKYLETVPDCGA